MLAKVALSALGAGLLLLLALGLWNVGSGGPAAGPTSAGPPPAPSPDRLALERELEAERAARAELEAEVGRLEGELARLAAAGAEHAAATEPPAATADPAAREELGSAAGDPLDARSRQGFDEASLIGLGLPDRDAARLRRRFEGYELDELYLRDQARREGWFRRPRYAQEIRALRNELREEVGDETYDLMLYASGRRNRVRLEQILSDSPAERAGLQAGDVIRRYDGRVVFGGPDLQIATTLAEAGASVPVDVWRGGEEMRIYVPGGPLGVRLNPFRQAPEVQW